jgi:hypothetical protein
MQNTLPSRRFGCIRVLSESSEILITTSLRDCVKAALFCVFAEAGATLKGILFIVICISVLIHIAL